MLCCHIIPEPDLKNEVLQSLAEISRTWVVNDLETKFWMQSLLRQKSDLIAGDQVLRASELWQKLLLKHDLEWQILPPAFGQFLIEKWMVEILKDNELKLSAKDCRRAYQTIGQILPLLSHFAGSEALDDWFSESQSAKERWYDWYQLGRLLWQKFFDHKLIPMDWMKAVLVNAPMEDFVQKDFVFDLGMDMDDVESELILNLSRQNQVDVIIPASEVERDNYADLIGRSQVINYDKSDKRSCLSTYKKFPSMLSEVKDVVATLRGWMDQGIKAHEVAIVSPAIENYWPTLSEYLLVEGVPFDKKIVAPLSQFEVYQRWLAKMRLALNKMQNSDGQQVVFSDVDEPVVNFDQFLHLFDNVFETKDFQRNDWIDNFVPTAVDPGEEVSFSDYLQWGFSLVEKKDWGELSQCLPDFDDLVFVAEKLSFENWLNFFENYFSRTEKKIRQADSQGVAVLSPSSALNKTFKKMFVMGLSENNLKEKQETALHWTDVESIKMKFGFNLPHADRFKLLDQLQWLSMKSCDEMTLSMAETDFSGQFQAPSLLWLKGAIDKNHSMELDSPQSSRWDEIINESPEFDWQALSVDRPEVLSGIQRDLGQREYEEVPIDGLSLSASSLEEYFKCPFRFFSQKALGLSHLPSLDLDIDYMTRGRLIHKICEEVLGRQGLALNDSSIDRLVEFCRKDIDMPVYNGEIWKFLKPFYLQLTKSFISFEIDWRKEHPATQTFAVEQPIRTSLQLTEEGFEFSPKGKIPFRGVIDRIDTDGEGQFAIIDYKTSGAGLRQYGSWLKNGKLQLALYSLALIEGSLDGEKKDIVGAFYYVMRGLERSKGFVISESNPLFLKSKKMDRESLADLLMETKKLVGLLMSDIVSGKMGPKPYDESLCETCDWNSLCRYPALNR